MGTSFSAGHQSHIANLGVWEISIHPAEKGWRIIVSNRQTGNRHILGPLPSGDLEEAKKQAEVFANEIMTKGGDKSGPLVWRPAPSRIKVNQEQERKKTWFQRTITLVTVMTGVVASLATLLISFPRSRFVSSTAEQDALVRSIVQRLDGQVARLDALTRIAEQSPPSNAQIVQALTSIEVDIKGLKERLSNYEAAIGDDPAKRLAVPMLKRDMDALKDTHKADLTALHEEMSRTFDLMKWLLGLLGIGSIIGGLSSWFGRGKS